MSEGTREAKEMGVVKFISKDNSGKELCLFFCLLLQLETFNYRYTQL